MNKKGMTLIELLVVIGILSMLFMLVAPNAIKSFKNSKKNAFLSEVQTIFSTAVAQVQVDHPKRVRDFTYCRINGENCEKAATDDYVDGLELTGNTVVDYIVLIDRKNNVKYFAASNGEYQYYSFKEVSDVSDITIDDITEVSETTQSNVADLAAIIGIQDKIKNNETAGYLDVNLKMKSGKCTDSSDGVTTSCCHGDASILKFDVYINDVKVATNVKDYYTTQKYGTKYKVVAHAQGNHKCNTTEHNNFQGIFQSGKQISVNILCE